MILDLKQLALIALTFFVAITAVSIPKQLAKDEEPFIGSSVLDEVPLVDGHNDLPWNLYNMEKNEIAEFPFDSDLRQHPRWSLRTSSHTDLVRIREGKLGGQFWVAYVSCTNNYKDAVERTFEQIDVIKRLIEKYPNDMKYVTTADGILEAFEEKKIASMIEIEGGHSIDSRLSVLRTFYELGVRCMTLTHSCNLPWADASPVDDDPEGPKRDLTDWGIKVVHEMNRLGMIVDISHVSEGVMNSVLDNSKAQVLFSHSSVFAVRNHHRNVKDHILLKLKEKNGLIMINFYTDFIGGDTIDKAIEHINYVRDLIGSEHVGIGGDYDGVNSTPVGLEDVSKYPNLFDKLAEEGHGYEPWTKEELKNLAGLNLIRVFRDVERVRDELKDSHIFEDYIPYDDIKEANPDVGTCRTDIEFYKTDFIGSSVLDEVPLVDGHNDLPYQLYSREKNLLDNFDFTSDLKVNPRWSNSHTDLRRIREGKLGGQFWVAFVSCERNYKDAVERTVEQIDVIKRLIKRYPNEMTYVTTADGILEAFKEKKIASMIEVEGGHSIDSRLSVLRLFYELGVRCMTLTHSCNLPWADASPIDDNPEITKRDLTDWGINVVQEMNRLGMIVDISHVSEGVMNTVLDHSKAPVIFSHSSVFAIRNHHRNVKDHILLKLKEKNGLIMINFYTDFIGGNTIDKAIEHINYVRDLIGSEHVGIGGDYDGVDSTPIGLEDVSKYPSLFDKLAEDGHGYKPWTKEELKNLAGLNLIRVFKDVERVRDELKDSVGFEKNVPYDDVIEENPEVQQCRTDIEFYKPQAMVQQITIEL